jgi:DNA-binding transcriptional LysR family regulator
MAGIGLIEQDAELLERLAGLRAGRSGRIEGESSMSSEPWSGVEPRHLATFAAVAETGSFRAAAARFGYVQSAVSQHVAQLEQALGATLIERPRGKVPLRLTPAGEALVGHAERIVQHVRAASADVAQLTGDGALRVVVEPVAASLVADVALRMDWSRPEPRMTVTELPGAQHADLLTSGRADVAIGAATAATPGLHRVILRSDPWVLVVASGSPLAAAPARLESLAMLRGLPLIHERSQPLPVDPDDLGMYVVAQCDRAAVAIELVRAGAGCAILPALAVGCPEDDICAVALDALVPARVISIAWSGARHLPPISGAFDRPRPAAGTGVAA